MAIELTVNDHNDVMWHFSFLTDIWISITTQRLQHS